MTLFDRLFGPRADSPEVQEYLDIWDRRINGGLTVADIDRMFALEDAMPARTLTELVRRLAPAESA